MASPVPHNAKEFNLAEALAGKPVINCRGERIPRECLIYVPTHSIPKMRLLTITETGYGIHDPLTGKSVCFNLDLYMEKIQKRGYINLYRSANGLIHCSDRPHPTPEEADRERQTSLSGQWKTKIGGCFVIYEE